MATIHQIDANRRNALKSTGPKTPRGKAAVRMNSLRHGLRARTVVLPGESREEFNLLCDDLEREWQPLSRTAQFYLEQMAVSQWKLTRMEVAEAGIFQESAAAKTQLPLLDRLWQAQCRLERSYARAQRELERLQHQRPKVRRHGEEEEPAPEPVVDSPSSAAASPAPKRQPVQNATTAEAPSADKSPRVRNTAMA